MQDVPEPGVEADGSAAWQRFCDTIGSLGEALRHAPFPAEPGAVAEGLAHLGDQVVCWLAWATEHADPSRPRFQRHNDLVTQWGGPNADNVYRHARIEPDRRYRVSGHMHGCEEFLLAIRSGFMHTDTWGTLSEITASEIGIAPGEPFEILLGGPDGVEIPDGAVMVSVREYYLDWTDRPPADFVIECLDPDPADPPGLAARFDEAAALVDASMRFWNDYLAEARAQRTPNTFDRPVDVAKGLSVAKYAFCFWELGPDEALIIDTDVPAARYYSLQLYSLGWFEPIDLEGRITSRNARQLHVDDDGHLRAVLSRQDPGAANWLDTAGRRTGLCILRWFWPDDAAAPPSPGATRTSVAEAAAALGGVVSPERRREESARRRAHLARRFAT